MNKEVHSKNVIFPKKILMQQDKINLMPDVNDDPFISPTQSKYVIRRAEDVQAEHRSHMNDLFHQLRKAKSQTRYETLFYI